MLGCDPNRVHGLVPAPALPLPQIESGGVTHEHTRKWLYLQELQVGLDCLECLLFGWCLLEVQHTRKRLYLQELQASLIRWGCCCCCCCLYFHAYICRIGNARMAVPARAAGGPD